MKRLLNTVYSLLGRLYEEPPSAGPGETSQQSTHQSNGVSSVVQYAVTTQEVLSQGSTTSPQSLAQRQASLDGTPSSRGFWHPQADGRSFVLPVTMPRQQESEKSESNIESIAKEFMKDNQQLMENLAEADAWEKAQAQDWAKSEELKESQSPSEDTKKNESVSAPSQQTSRSSGVKHDGGKPRLDLIPREAMEGLGRVLAFGAIKYSAGNWSKGIEYSRLIAATFRHLIAFASGEDLDPESRLSHIHHAQCNLAFLAYMIEHRKDLDNRWSKE